MFFQTLVYSLCVSKCKLRMSSEIVTLSLPLPPVTHQNVSVRMSDVRVTLVSLCTLWEWEWMMSLTLSLSLSLSLCIPFHTRMWVWEWMMWESLSPLCVPFYTRVWVRMSDVRITLVALSTPSHKSVSVRMSGGWGSLPPPLSHSINLSMPRIAVG